MLFSLPWVFFKAARQESSFGKVYSIRPRSSPVKNELIFYLPLRESQNIREYSRLEYVIVTQ